MSQDRPIRVVLVVDDLGYGGAERQVVELANNMDHDRFDVHVCALSDHLPLRDQLQIGRHNVHVIRRRTRFDITLVPRLARLLRKVKADIVHGYLFRADNVGRLAGRLAGTELIIGTERSAKYRSTRRNWLAYRLTRGCVDLVIANSKTGADFNRATYGHSSLEYRVVYNGVNTERFRLRNRSKVRSQLGLSDTLRIVGVVASFKPVKNHAMVLRAFKTVRESSPDSHLLLVGDQLYGNIGGTSEYQAEIRGLIDELGLAESCTFLGNRDDVELIYPACDLTVLASFYEGTPNVLLESMACGIPVVATDVSDNSYIVRENDTGFLVAVGDVTQMAHRMELLLGNNTLRQEMGRKARNRVLDEFSSQRLAEKTQAIYMQFLDKKRSCTDDVPLAVEGGNRSLHRS